MARDFVISGESLVKVKFNFGEGTVVFAELGLTTDQIRIMPKFFHKDIMVDDFGPNAPAEVLQYLAEVQILMTLIHFDQEVLDICVAKSMGLLGVSAEAGIFCPAGTPMGGGQYADPDDGDYTEAYKSPKFHYISLNILSPQNSDAWRFPTSYLAEQPFEYPLGTEASAVQLRWRAIGYGSPNGDGEGEVAYPGELVSAGTVIWDHLVDTA